jgi:hypothetical protein
VSETSGVAADDRVGDDDRERIVRDLTKHCGDGRLTLDELEERVAEVYAATTLADLDNALRELPRSPVPIPKPLGPPLRTRPSAAPVREQSAVQARRASEIALRVHMAVYLSIIGMLVAIYMLTDPFGYPWPIWPAIGWGVALAIHAGVHKAVWPKQS